LEVLEDDESLAEEHVEGLGARTAVAMVIRDVLSRAEGSTVAMEASIGAFSDEKRKPLSIW
jgi:hypothetical protein